MKKLIYLEDAVDVIKKYYRICDDLLEVIAYEDLLEVIAHEIEQLQSAEPDVPDINDGDMISRKAAIVQLSHNKTGDDDCDVVIQNDIETIKSLPSAEPEWNNHTVACLLAEMFGEDCACNFNGIDEWLPEKCEVIDSCPNPAGVACWEQFLKHRAERRTDEVS